MKLVLIVYADCSYFYFQRSADDAFVHLLFLSSKIINSFALSIYIRIILIIPQSTCYLLIVELYSPC